MSGPAPAAQPFRLALIQMGGVTADKSHNLAHARDLILKASQPQDGNKPGLVVLPVGYMPMTLEKF
jgi:predicted amidohydrolase